MRKTSIPLETIIELRQRLERWPKRSPERRTLILETAELYGVSPETWLTDKTMEQHSGTFVF